MNAVVDMAHSLDVGLDDLAETAGPIEILDLCEAQGLDGEVYLVGDDFRAKICFSRGRLAWVYCSTLPIRLTHTLNRELGLPRPLLEQSVHACRSRGQRFGEYLVEEGLVEFDRLRKCLLRHQAGHMRHLALAPGEFELAVVDQRHRYDARLTFELDELLGEVVLGDVQEPPAGVRGRAVVNLATRQVCVSRGEPLDPGVLAMALGAASTLHTSTHLGNGPQIYRAKKRDVALVPAVSLGRIALVMTAAPNFLGTLARYANQVSDTPLFTGVTII